ncbi:TadE/TadG family type IV pilus assembly protein [Streptomyces sp. NRRL F-5123]|uniref:TadE/TadG family type IV pilus assembly protein n=1 Tax=Streptomyces sp. NRRL F-5123 TaxID=1463856 RepID=UPI0004E1F39D|nr:TadE/TadG family type IV pilus assembly protein [Streptomyces sp. NRRL F-5123]
MNRSRQEQGERGSATVELVLGVPVLVLMFWLLIYCGRASDTRLRIEDAAHQGARAASSDPTASVAAADARATATAALSDAGVACRSVTVTTRGSLAPGSAVTVTVACTVGLEDLVLLHLPGTTTMTAHFTALVDVYRSTDGTAP